MESHRTKNVSRVSRRELLGAAASAMALPALAPDAALGKSTGAPSKRSSFGAPAVLQFTEISVMFPTQLPPPTPRDDNLYWQEIEKRLGVRIDFQAVPSDQYVERVSTALASGDLPDLMRGAYWGDEGFLIRQAAQQGAFVRLEEFGLPEETRDYPGLDIIPDFAWRYGGFNGVIYGVPTPGFQFGRGEFLRTDWIDKLGMALPTTTEELTTLLAAFVTDDPDGNGQADSVGFSIGANRNGWTLFTKPFGVPNNWRWDAEAQTLTHADVTAEMKAAVAYARELYALGVFNRDFPALPDSEVRQEASSGLSGGYFGTNLAFAYGGLGADLREVVPTADVYPIDPVVADGFQRVTYLEDGVNQVTQINGKYAGDEEMVWELLRIHDFWLDPATTTFVNFGIEGVHYTVGEDGKPVPTEKGIADIQILRSSVGRHYEPYITAPYIDSETYDKIVAATDRLAAFGIPDPTWGLYPPFEPGQDPSAQLGDLATATFERVIRGEESLEALDEFVDEWNEQGGSELTEAMTELYLQSNQ